jgi:glycosyltransferase involved in cell wall biosynthesis
MRIQILLGTYNLGRYLDEFIESLRAQDRNDWALLARDDCSSDDTPERLDRWRTRLADQLQILPDSGSRNLGSPGNFSRLLEASSADYIMLADPDDVWQPTKLSRTLAAMRAYEARVGTDRPVLAHTDLTMVDESLRVLAPSFWRYQGLTPDRGHAFSRMIVENQVWACTAMLNRPLVELVGPVPRETIHQDWWIALVAAAFGSIVSLDEPTILWRRHDSNNSPVSELNRAAWGAVAGVPKARRRLAALFAESRPRVSVFLERFHDRLTADQVAAAEAFLQLPEMGALERRRAILRHRLLFTSPVRNLGLLALI